MLNLSNSISLIRAPLAFLFLQESPILRLVAIALAMITDSVDGYLARKRQTAGMFGAVLDPVMDKFFVTFALGVFFLEEKLTFLQVVAMLSRDVSLALYALFLALFGKWRRMVLRSIRWGKITTALQFVVLMGLSLDCSFSWALYSCFIVMGSLAFVELLQLVNPFSTRANN